MSEGLEWRTELADDRQIDARVRNGIEGYVAADQVLVIDDHGHLAVQAGIVQRH